MMAVLHVAGLAGRRGGVGGDDPGLLEAMADAVLGGRIHFPLRVVKAHVAGLAGLGLLGFLFRESMARVAGIAGSHAETPAGLLQLRDLRSDLRPIL